MKRLFLFPPPLLLKDQVGINRAFDESFTYRKGQARGRKNGEAKKRRDSWGRKKGRIRGKGWKFKMEKSMAKSQKTQLRICIANFSRVNRNSCVEEVEEGQKNKSLEKMIEQWREEEIVYSARFVPKIADSSYHLWKGTRSQVLFGGKLISIVIDGLIKSR